LAVDVRGGNSRHDLAQRLDEKSPPVMAAKVSTAILAVHPAPRYLVFPGTLIHETVNKIRPRDVKD
jgi:hypothetical protein